MQSCDNGRLHNRNETFCQALNHQIKTRRVAGLSVTSIVPETFETVWSDLSVPDRVADVLMPQVCLQAAGIDAAVAQLVAAGMAQLVRVHRVIEASGSASKLAAYGPTTEMIAAVGLPAPPLAFAVAVAVELGGGLLLIAGFQTRLVATALALFSLVTAVSFHSNFADQNQMIHFLKNVMMAGGLLQIVGFGAGAISVDNRLSRGREAIAHVAPAG
jgi:putative oxidoreductase